jgi:hypothetical protein
VRAVRAMDLGRGLQCALLAALHQRLHPGATWDEPHLKALQVRCVLRDDAA